MKNSNGHWFWMLLAGLAFIALGVVSVMIPIASTVGLTYGLAALLVATGIVQLVHAAKSRHEQSRLMRLLQSLLAIVVGVLIFAIPSLGMLGISLALSFYFFVGAAINWVLAQTMLLRRARFWVYLNSLASFILGFYIVYTFPISALWVPGTLLGIEFLFTGFGLTGLAFATKGSSAILHPQPT